MKTEEVIYYWYCPACKLFEHQKADSIPGARLKLEEHEKEKHKGKPVGTFGKKFK
jgi:hypothetical protein